MKTITLQTGRAKKLWGTVTLIVGLIGALLAVHALSQWDKEIPSFALQDVEASSSPPSCRYGISATNNQQAIAAILSPGWLLFFDGTVNAADPLVEATPLIRVKQKKSGATYLDDYATWPPLPELGAKVADLPGRLWLVGNEPDRGAQPGETVSGQDDTMPEMYARAYHDIYHFIKEIDPTAQVANGALVQITPGRLQYLDLVYQAYLDLYGEPMKVDVWNMHLYALPEVTPDGKPNNIANVALGTDPALGKRESGYNENLCPLEDVYCLAEHDDIDVLAQQLLAMRKWMHKHGQQEKPLIITEYSLLYPYESPGWPVCMEDEYGNCFTPDRVANFLNQSMDYLETATHPVYGNPLDNGRLVQQWNWFMVATNYAGKISNLIGQEGGGLTLAGQAYQARTASAPRYVNLFPSVKSSILATSDTSTGETQAVLTVTIINNGSIPLDHSFDVAFYRDAAQTDLIGTVNVPAPSLDETGLPGCARLEIEASIIWSQLGPGLHSYWVNIDSGDHVVEGNPGGENDNVISGYVLVDPDQVFLPVIRR